MTNKSKFKEIIDARQSANSEILSILNKYVEKYPELRFGQILAVAKVIEYGYKDVDGGKSEIPIEIVQDPFNEESIRTLNRVKEQTFYILKKK